eukprot:CAMPEP_0184392974 /NCGR_PEP_ID=MMETSP0007-20130409/31878_1 /TAXON_ID=97485 /ORGANISM="Prymnesium parvum, Strain Texoma1" /LENGTH=287 /DNA_ID=CAMNT_0026743757 /DNA_START=265 /DNA_END=1126 /DNA_ORIENTATION=-
MDIAEASTARGINTLHPGPQPLASKLFLALRFQGGADAAALRAHLEHKLPVGLTLLVDRPPAARLVVIGAHRRAQPARLGALARHEVRIRDALPVAAHCLHSVAFATSAHTLSGCSLHTSHAAGHVLNMKPGFASHSPAAAQPGQSFSLSLHLAVHTPQLTGHFLAVNSGFFTHSPRCAQPGHSAMLSTHSGVQMPHVVGHVRSMKAAFASHSPARPHEAQVALRSAQVWLHTPQASGQMRDMYSGFVAQCSSFAQKPHSAFLSLQIPARSSGASAANMAAAELTKY